MEPLWIDFLNSDYRDYRGRGEDRDLLESPEWRRELLRRCGLGRPRLTGPHLKTLHELRRVLRRLAEKAARGDSPGAADLRRLNKALAAAPVHLRLIEEDTGWRIEETPNGSVIQSLVTMIAASFARTLAEADPSRVRLCDNPDCRWVFYDDTRSRSRRWCADTCGNLMKVRRFRKNAEAPKRRNAEIRKGR